MKRYDYLIVGAGLSGCVFAHEMGKRGKICLVVEKREQIGGNVRTERVRGIQVHMHGAHIFHTSDGEIWEYIRSFAEFNRFINAPVARYRDEVYNLPFNMNTFSRLWHIATPDEAKAEIARQIAAEGIAEPKNLEEKALSLVGRDVYEKLIKGYTEKQWGRSATELPSFIIGRVPVRFVYDNNYFDDRYQGIPVGGYTAICEKMLREAEVRLHCDYLSHREELNALAEKVYYTGMLDEYFGYRFGTLEYRSLRFETEILERENYQGNAVVNYTEREVSYTRIIEHKHFEFGNQPCTVVTREYPQKWKKGAEPYYPINDERNNALYERYAALAAAEKNVLFGGRLGLYRYLDMDDAIAASLALVKKELSRQSKSRPQ